MSIWLNGLLHCAPPFCKKKNFKIYVIFYLSSGTLGRYIIRKHLKIPFSCKACSIKYQKICVQHI